MYKALLLLLMLGLPVTAQQSGLQQSVDSALGRSKGSIVVLDVHSGKLLAAKNLDSAATRLASPGSLLKPFVVLALQKAPGFDPQERVFCRRNLHIGTHDLRCSHPDRPVSLNAAESIAYSCNYYFADRAKLFSKEDLLADFRGRGLTTLTGLASTEQAGRIRVPKTADETKLLALGTRMVEVTPLQIAVLYRNLALEINQPGNAVVAAGLRSAIDYGSGIGARNASITVAGKTGTASTRGAAGTSGWFVGYAPAEKPEIVVLVFIDRGRGLTAASLARPVFEAYAAERKPQ
jgi:cell division protein FtsI/penicillin-binding protein 2